MWKAVLSIVGTAPQTESWVLQRRYQNQSGQSPIHAFSRGTYSVLSELFLTIQLTDFNSIFHKQNLIVVLIPGQHKVSFFSGLPIVLSRSLPRQLHNMLCSTKQRNTNLISSSWFYFVFKFEHISNYFWVSSSNRWSSDPRSWDKTTCISASTIKRKESLKYQK